MNILLIEILTEELPANCITISDEFAFIIIDELKRFFTDATICKSFITPRRFGCVITDILDKKDIIDKKKGPSITSNEIAISGFAKTVKRDIKDLLQENGYFYCVKTTLLLIAYVINSAINKSIKKSNENYRTMRYSVDGKEYEFIRPIRNILVMLDDIVVDCFVYGLNSKNTTATDRFTNIAIDNAKNYFHIMKNNNIILDFEERKNFILSELLKHTDKINLYLLDEVTGLTEYPVILKGRFDETYLSLPNELIDTVMIKHQRYFSIYKDGNITNEFLIVANSTKLDYQIVIKGNENVLKCRLIDAKYFYEKDLLSDLMNREKLETSLKSIVYYKHLTQLDQIKYIENIAKSIKPVINATLNSEITDDDITTVAYLLKADLRSSVVQEFPELQGIMGMYYAKHDKYPEYICDAVADHYLPRYAGDKLAIKPLSLIMALSEKFCVLICLGLLKDIKILDGGLTIDTKLISFTVSPEAISMIQPDGQLDMEQVSNKLTNSETFKLTSAESIVNMEAKWNVENTYRNNIVHANDPHGIRRAGIGIMRMLVENNISISQILYSINPLYTAEQIVFKGFNKQVHNKQVQSTINPGIIHDYPWDNLPRDSSYDKTISSFILSRLKSDLYSRYDKQLVNSLLNHHAKNNIDKFGHVESLLTFITNLDKNIIHTIIASNKRVENILKTPNTETVDTSLLNEKELTIYNAVKNTTIEHDWQLYFDSIYDIALLIGDMFDNSKIIVDDILTMENRIKLLTSVYNMFNLYCNISELP